MTLEQYASLGELVAAIAVVASFVYLGLQIKQTGRAIGAQTRDSIADGFMAINMPVVSDPAAARIFALGLERPGALSDIEAVQFSMLLRAVFNQFDRVQKLRRLDLISESNWTVYAKECAAIMATPGGSQYVQGNELAAVLKADVSEFSGQAPNVDFLLGRDVSSIE